jgi:glycosyltransferase involved in cell wall biosynthesis/predicted SAM-dependent methyltransferase
MKIAIIFSDIVCSKPLDFERIYSDPRGLTGSDLGVIRVSEELVKLGHEVSLFTNLKNDKPEHQGVKLYPFNERFTIENNYDAIMSWCDPEAFRGINTTALKLVTQQWNDFNWCKPGFDELVDIFTSVSKVHMEHLKSFGNTNPNKWRVIGNGCDPELYKGVKKVPNRMIWASSADRGLHLLLQEWVNIRKEVPDAHLRIFYDFSFGYFTQFQKGSKQADPVTMEIAQRIRYIQIMLEKLKSHGVELIGSVSRGRINKEMAEATMMAFPCSTVTFTEGFSVATMEACAAGACPVICATDALGDIYKDVVPTAPKPTSKNIGAFTELVIRGLKDAKYRNEVNAKCMKFAEDFSWAKIAKQYEDILVSSKRSSIHRVKEVRKPEKITKLNVGCGPLPFPGWINYDRTDVSGFLNYLRQLQDVNYVNPDIRPLAKYLQAGGDIDVRQHDIRQKFIQHADESVDLIYLGQVIEHINPIKDAPELMREFYRMLKPGGILRMVTPDLSILIDAYNKGEMNKFESEQPEFYKECTPSEQLAYIMYGTGGEHNAWNNYEGHMFLYTKDSMERLIKKGGFNGEPVFFYEPKKSINEVMANEVYDAGMTHSFIVEIKK